MIHSNVLANRYFPSFSIALTKLDILDSLPELKICVGYILNGKKLDEYPASEADLRKVEVRKENRLRRALEFFLFIFAKTVNILVSF